VTVHLLTPSPATIVLTIAEDGSCAAIATLGDLVRMTGADDTGEAGHEP
jgi:hypothetical protein